MTISPPTGERVAFDGLVLDMDGVIVDTPTLHRRVWAEFVESAPWPELRDRPRGAVGRRSKDVLTEVLGDRVDRGEIDGIVADLHTRFLRLARARDTVFPGMRALITGLSGRVPLAIGTSAPRHVVRELLGDVLGMVDVTITSDECAAGKPDPEVYVRACAGLGLPADRVLVIEDTSIGVRAGTAAGCAVWAIAVEPTTASTALEAGAVVVARDAEEMASIVDARFGVRDRLSA